MLAEEGWADLDRDGVLEKEIDGKKVIFSSQLIYANRGPVGKATVEAIVTQLKKVGIRAELVGSRVDRFERAMNQKDFDALYLGWEMVPLQKTQGRFGAPVALMKSGRKLCRLCQCRS